jgi:hypothetical protein
MFGGPKGIRVNMFWIKKDRDKERFYLLAGMGGRSHRRKHLHFLAWSLLAGSVVAGILALSLYFVNKPL